MKPLPSASLANQNVHISQCIGQRAGNLFQTHQLWCSGAVLLTLNQGFGGDLCSDLAIRLSEGLCDGMGGSGCLCGGLNGAALALGLFLGTGKKGRIASKMVMKATRAVHDQFKAAFGSVCCRCLVKDHHGHPHQLCTQRTAKAAELAAWQILKNKPDLAKRVDWDFIEQKYHPRHARIKMMANRMFGHKVPKHATEHPATKT